MSASKCARCEQTVYPVEGLNCLDKIWHKGCFKCHECNMTLNMKNYKGYDKKPYCNAHCPQAKATTVADTPEIRRLAENTRIQSQAKYHEDFEKSKGKGFTTIADDPEIVRIKNTSKIISNVAYHGELERKKQMEEKRGQSGSEEAQVINNNQSKQQNRMKDIPRTYERDVPPHQTNNQHTQPVQQHQQLLMQQQQLLKQQQMRAHESNQTFLNRHSQQLELNQHIAKQQQLVKQIPNQQFLIHPQQQVIMRQQQQHQLHQQQYQQQQQQQVLMQRHSMDSSSALNRQASKQSMNNINPSQQQQQMIKQQMIQNQQPNINQYVSINDAMRHQPPPPQILSGGPPQPQMMNQSHSSGTPNVQRVTSNPSLGAPQASHQMSHGYGNHPHVGPMMNSGLMPKYTQQQIIYNPPNRQVPMHHSQMQSINHQVRPQVQPQQMPRRVFRAMYDYVANDVDEVSFFENDILVDCLNVDNNWLVGKVARSGQTGMLPANYVAEISG